MDVIPSSGWSDASVTTEMDMMCKAGRVGTVGGGARMMRTEFFAYKKAF